MTQIYDTGPTALLPFRRKSYSGFLRSAKIHRLRPGLNPRTSDPVTSMITIGPLFTIDFYLQQDLSGFLHQIPTLKSILILNIFIHNFMFYKLVVTLDINNRYYQMFKHCMNVKENDFFLLT